MKEIIKKTLIGLFAVVVLAGCNKDENANPEENRTADLLLVAEKLNGQTSFEMEYDKANRLIAWQINNADGSVHIQRFTYDENDRLVAHDRRTGGKIYLTESYSYQNDDRPVSGIWTYISDKGDESVSLVQYAYEQNTVTETVLGETASIVNVYQFDEKGNSIVHQIGRGTFEYADYDDKRGIYARHPWSWKIKYTNNYQSVRTSLTSTGDLISDQRYEYTYNEAGYPVKAEVYDKQTDELLEMREYSYKKAN